jgi:type II secretory pathway pseudopilin PulG
VPKHDEELDKQCLNIVYWVTNICSVEIQGVLFMTIFAVAMAILVVVMWLPLAVAVRRVRKRRKREVEEQRMRDFLKKQWSIGGRALAAIKQAASCNKTAYLLPSGEDGDAGPLLVSTITDNAGQSTPSSSKWVGSAESTAISPSSSTSTFATTDSTRSLGATGHRCVRHGRELLRHVPAPFL